MKRVGRWAFNILAGLSLMLCVATAVMWVQSYWMTDVVGYTWTLDPRPIRREIRVASTDGSISIRYDRMWRSTDDGFYWAAELPIGPGIPGWKTFEMQLGTDARGRVIWVRAPHWLFILLATIVPALWVVLNLRWFRRAKYGLCPNCSYDLRATPDRCPECGTVVSGLTDAEKERAAAEGGKS